LRRPIGAAVVLVALLAGGACAPPRLDRAGARAFTRDALRASGFREVSVLETTDECEVEGAEGWRATADTELGEVSICVSRSQGRALSVRDPGMSDAQFARLERYRGETAADRAMPLAIASSVLLLLGVLIQLLLHLRGRGPEPPPDLDAPPPGSTTAAPT
jgi:hypothetical protein